MPSRPGIGGQGGAPSCPRSSLILAVCLIPGCLSVADWNEVVIRPKKQTAATSNTEAAINAARRTGQHPIMLLQRPHGVVLKLKLLAVVHGGMPCHIAAPEEAAITVLEAVRPDLRCQICISQAAGGSPLVSPAQST